METTLSLDDVKEFQLSSFEDYRGEIYTIYDSKSIPNLVFNHDKIAIRHHNVLVGIHGDFNTWKLATCLYGRIQTVVVDKRTLSVDLNKWRSYILSDKNKKQLLIPPGIGNSFLVLSDFCVYHYKLAYTGDYVDSDRQFTLKWNDPLYNISWGSLCPILSQRDNI